MQSFLVIFFCQLFGYLVTKLMQIPSSVSIITVLFSRWQLTLHWWLNMSLPWILLLPPVACYIRSNSPFSMGLPISEHSLEIRLWLEMVVCCHGCNAVFCLMGDFPLAVVIAHEPHVSGSHLRCLCCCVLVAVENRCGNFPLALQQLRKQLRKLSLTWVLIKLWRGWRSWLPMY